MDTKAGNATGVYLTNSECVHVKLCQEEQFRLVICPDDDFVPSVSGEGREGGAEGEGAEWNLGGYG